ncbi:MAG: type III polyketide synthase [Bacteroidota bacterium]|nr:type III polyketide synthase [Bacteroidota bacterium]MDP4211717.1 type III polyketide synthase [Bacteroidota bacterium]MDP4250411.1 type III polyketide synthase [Bacteroidota bacterium]
MSQIKSIGTAVPRFKHDQNEILNFMSRIYAFNEKDRRKLRYLYGQSGISNRYSVLSDYSKSPQNWTFYPPTENLEPFPSLEKRMELFNQFAPALSAEAVLNCLQNNLSAKEITHLITVTCTGLSAPGLDLYLMDLLDLPKNIFRTSVNFMGCYAAIHALKLADAICNAEPSARVMIVCTELCTLHFQQEPSIDNITSSLLFGDGSAAVLVTGDDDKIGGFQLHGFYAEVIPKGKQDMSWALSSTGFAMTLSNYVPGLIEEDFKNLVENALAKTRLPLDAVSDWCIHPGGRKILEAIEKSLGLPKEKLAAGYEVLNDFGNMSSPTILFVLDKLFKSFTSGDSHTVFGAAFGPGLTMETFIAGN